MITTIINFLIDEMLWILTWGWYQLILSVIFSWMLFVFFGKMKTLRAIFLTLTSYTFSLLIYFAIVAGLFVAYFKWKFIAGESPKVLHAFGASVVLAIIYSVLQTIFYIVMHNWYRFSITRLALLSLISNITAALIASVFINISL